MELIQQGDCLIYWWKVVAQIKQNKKGHWKYGAYTSRWLFHIDEKLLQNLNKTNDKYGPYTTRWFFRRKSSAWKNQAKHCLKCKCSSVFDVKSRICHFTSISRTTQWIATNHSIEFNVLTLTTMEIFSENFFWTNFHSQGEGACKAETEHAEWLWSRGGDRWTDLESHQKVSSTDNMSIMVRNNFACVEDFE